MVCLYALEFPNGKFYIGISNKPYKRMVQHKSAARTGSNLPVHSALRKYGTAIMHEILWATVEEIGALEATAIATIGTIHPLGYNLTPGGESSPALCPDVAARISQTQKGKKLTPEHIRNMSIASKRTSRTPARIAQLAEARKNIKQGPRTEETKARLRAAWVIRKEKQARIA